MLNVSGILSHEREVTGLSRGALRVAVDSATKWLMICIDDKTSSFHVWTKVLDRQIEGEQLSVKSTILPFGRREFLREESQGILGGSLAQHSADSDVGGVCRHREHGRGVRVDQHCGPRKALLGLIKSKQLLRLPVQNMLLRGRGRRKGVERHEDSGDVGQEPVIEIYAA